jgi:hypothetical protein
MCTVHDTVPLGGRDLVSKVELDQRSAQIVAVEEAAAAAVADALNHVIFCSSCRVVSNQLEG